jgi:hypothetical protein
MAWFGRNTEQELAEASLLTSFYAASLAAVDSYTNAIERVEEGEVATLFAKLRERHTDFADDLRKRVKKLGGDPDDRSGIAEFGGRLAARINSVGSIRDLLISMRQGEENGVATCREALEESDLSGKSESLIEAYSRMHIDAIRDLSEQIAMRASTVASAIELSSPEWLRYPKAGFWALEAAVLGLGYLFGRGAKGAKLSDTAAGSRPTTVDWGGDTAATPQARELGK